MKVGGRKNEENFGNSLQDKYPQSGVAWLPHSHSLPHTDYRVNMSNLTNLPFFVQQRESAHIREGQSFTI